MRDLVGFESWLERDRVMLLDFLPGVVAFSSQPFWLTWPAGAKRRRHAPDFFARLADGTGLVIDVRADDDLEPEDAEAFAVTEEACRVVLRAGRCRRSGAGGEPEVAVGLQASPHPGSRLRKRADDGIRAAHSADGSGWFRGRPDRGAAVGISHAVVRTASGRPGRRAAGRINPALVQSCFQRAYLAPRRRPGRVVLADQSATKRDEVSVGAVPSR
jgi:hypothetical protein